jgi:hypothetical protein
MMRIVFVVCEALGGGQCQEAVIAFDPTLPVACVHAAASELESRIPEGWYLERWSCIEPLPGDVFAAE